MIKRYQKDDAMRKAVGDIRTDGVVIVEGLFTASVADELFSAVSDEPDAQEPGGGEFLGDSKRFVNALFARGPAFSDHLLLNEQLL